MKQITVAVLLCVATIACANEAHAPARKAGGPVSIPGNPLPPMDPQAIRDAIPIYERLLRVLRASGDSVSTARGLGYLATLYAAVGNSPKAEQLFGDALTILHKRHASGEDIGWVNNNRGLVQITDEKYAEALQSFRAALEALDPKASERVVVLGNLATAYNLLGDDENAEEAYLDALDLLKKPGIARFDDRPIRLNLAILYSNMGDYTAATQILEKLLKEPDLGQTLHFDALNTLGFAYAGLQRFPEGLGRLKDAMALTKEDSQQRSYVLTNLASVYARSGDYAQAEVFGQKALQLSQKLYGDDSRPVAGAMAELGANALSRGELDKADQLMTRAAGVLSKGSGDEEVYASTLRGMALAAQLRGQFARAHELSVTALDLTKKHLERILAFGSESQRLAYRGHASPYDQLANLGDPVLLEDAVLSMKGVVLDSLLAERALIRNSRSPEDRAELESMKSRRVQIMEKISRGEDVETLARSLKDSETALAKRLAPQVRRAPQATTEAVQEKLKDDQVLVEIIVYQRFQPGAKLVPSYGAVVIPKSGAPLWIPLGPTAPVDEKIRDLVTSLNRRAPALSRGIKPVYNPSDPIEPLLRQLNDELWEPLSKRLPRGTQSILLSPDGATSFLPWCALLDAQNRFLAERWALTQISAGRDVVRPRTPLSSPTFFAFGNATGDLRFTEDEAKSAGETAEKHGWHPTVKLREQATEAELFQLRGPGILHLGAHGGIMASDPLNRMSRNPMYRGIVLLNGGWSTLDKWQHGESLPTSFDGVLTAEEAGALDLGGTWLTVLSACETGGGDALTGEGVMGLRRGFTLAGTNYLMFSLWKVKDDATARFMSAFYERLFTMNDPEGAFQETQKSELLRWKRETGSVGEAVYRAGGLVLTQ